MFASLFVVLPIFALVFAGWAARRLGALGDTATREVNRLVVYLALPALLFDIMANADPAELWRPGFIAAFALGCAIVFAGTLAVRMVGGRKLADATLESLNASYANTGFMGFPLILAVLGESALVPTLVATILTVSVLFGIAIILIEFGRQTGARRRDIWRKTALALVTNPLLVAPVLGVLLMASGLALPSPVQSFLDLLGAAASPCALIALGLFLAQTPDAAEGNRTGLVAALTALKLIAQPAATWLVAGPLLGLPPATVHLVVLLAALPTGTGPFMLAELYGRGGVVTSRVVLLTTVLSVVTLSAYLMVMPAG